MNQEQFEADIWRLMCKYKLHTFVAAVGDGVMLRVLGVSNSHPEIDAAAKVLCSGIQDLIGTIKPRIDQAMRDARNAT